MRGDPPNSGGPPGRLGPSLRFPFPGVGSVGPAPSGSGPAHPMSWPRPKHGEDGAVSQATPLRLLSPAPS